ncbi:MBL fold metallo-hydrolase [uncultured Methanobrevibacter sp.]|uniref:MBL fold metallo-hydrolase n=1 Tax=uncultured Methanobrevibacter sp. TaxID=253161 RepID=UPI00261E6114
MKLIFLGSGGGRFATISQKRMTGGFRIDNFGGKNYHVDPGPGALVRSYQFGVNPTKIDGIFISHSHTDHYNDAEILIEAMTRGMTKNNGIIMGSTTVFEKYKRWGPALSTYHKSNSKNLMLTPNKIKKFPNFSIKGTETRHGDPTGVGFQMEANDFRISYTADTRYFDELAKYHKNADILIGSVLRPGEKSIKGHMCTQNFIDLVDDVQPKLAVMTHFGFKMIAANPVEEAISVFRKTGVRTLAAFDGMCVDINEKNPERSRMIRLKDRFAARLKPEEVYSLKGEFRPNSNKKNKNRNYNNFNK